MLTENIGWNLVWNLGWNLIVQLRYKLRYRYAATSTLFYSAVSQNFHSQSGDQKTYHRPISGSITTALFGTKCVSQERAFGARNSLPRILSSTSIITANPQKSDILYY